MYQAPDFVKVDFKIDEAFATYNCKYVSDGRIHYVFTGPNCDEYERPAGSDISGSVSGVAPWECWLSPSE